jgi:hypothetical protein
MIDTEAVADRPMGTTFYDDTVIEVEILSRPTSTGLVRVRGTDGVVLARHVNRLTQLNAAARKYLGM